MIRRMYGLWKGHIWNALITNLSSATHGSDYSVSTSHWSHLCAQTQYKPSVINRAQKCAGIKLGVCSCRHPWVLKTVFTTFSSCFGQGYWLVEVLCYHKYQIGVSITFKALNYSFKPLVLWLFSWLDILKFLWILQKWKTVWAKTSA